MSKCRRINEENFDRQHYDFGVSDAKGRALGAYVTRLEFDYILAPEDARSWSPDCEPGHYFAYRPHAARGRAPFGASQSMVSFKTEAEREADIERYLAAAKKRAQKLASK